MRMGIVSERRQRRKAQLARKRLGIVLLLIVLCALAASDDLKRLAADARAFTAQMPVFSGEKRPAQTELTLPERKLCALQLAVFDSGARAQSEAARLKALGVRCVIWQREKVRLLAAVATEREMLDRSAARGQDVYVLEERLAPVSLRLTADKGALEAVQELLQTPDSVCQSLMDAQGEALSALVARTRERAQAALSAHPDNRLYTELAQSLEAWCELMDSASQEMDERQARTYAAVTMCTLDRELRAALTGV